MTHRMAVRNPAPPISTATVRERPAAPENAACFRTVIRTLVSSTPFTPKTRTGDRR